MSNCQHHSFQASANIHRHELDGAAQFTAQFQVKCAQCGASALFAVHIPGRQIQISQQGLSIAVPLVFEPQNSEATTSTPPGTPP